ncbi:MAG: peptide chain release factor 1 [SAR202 cluster bacterium]|nr:peptide chain release factor 1 [SAR202 cluster bacterium]
MLEKIKQIEDRFEEINQLLTNPEISKDHVKVRELIKEQTKIKSIATLSTELGKVESEIQDANDIIRTENDKELTDLAKSEMENLKLKKDDLELQLRISLIPDDPNNEKNVIMEIRAGTGGDEAGLFANDLFRMYSRFSQKNNWKINIINMSETGIGGIKEIVFQIIGKGAYSKLKHETGGHRVQRVPATESSGRIHTSAATVAVLPEAEEVDVNINPEDLNIDIFHASGHGGQSVNKVATAIRITHIPTGTVAVCQDERSQLKNKEKAMSVLRSRILDQRIRDSEEERSAERKAQIGSGDRSQKIRTYNFPQERITDHRINLSTHNLELVLNGDLDIYIEKLIDHEQAILLEQSSI